MGGTGADFRLFLPFKALADSFYVLMWDSRDAGLSERVTKEELSIASFSEETPYQTSMALKSQAKKVTTCCTFFLPLAPKLLLLLVKTSFCELKLNTNPIDLIEGKPQKHLS